MFLWIVVAVVAVFVIIPALVVGLRAMLRGDIGPARFGGEDGKRGW